MADENSDSGAKFSVVAKAVAAVFAAVIAPILLAAGMKWVDKLDVSAPKPANSDHPPAQTSDKPATPNDAPSAASPAVPGAPTTQTTTSPIPSSGQTSPQTPPATTTASKAAAESIPATSDSTDAWTPVGTWEIHGGDGGKTKWTGTMVLNTGKKGAYLGHIDWTAKGGEFDGAGGREFFRATYVPSTRLLTIEGKRLEKAHLMALGVYTAELGQQGNRLIKGKWNSDGSLGGWTATRVGKP